MSPASQGNLEVERYIGSYLISSSVRVNNIGGKNSSASSHSNVNYKGKKVLDCGGSRVGKLHAGALNNRTTGGACRDQFSATGYSSRGSLLPLCECGGLKFGGAGYGSRVPGTGVGGSWAGLPLISMAPSNSRRNRKPSAPSNGSVNNGTGNSRSPSGSQTAVVANPSSGKNSFVNADHTSQYSRTPLSRLAIHTQGAPLILAGRYNVNGRKSNAFQNRGPPLQQFRCGDLNIRRSNSARDTRDTGGSGGNASGNNSNTPNSDCLSVASDESSGHSENSLPRIIKPRKRRKKDRKPPPLTVTSTSDTSSPPSSKELKNPALESPGIVTLKPYVPLCYELYDSGRWIGNLPSLVKQDTKGSIRAWEVENKNTFTLCNVNGTQEDDEHGSQTSEDDSQEPKLHHNFDEVEDDDDGLFVESGAFPYPCPPSLCHCRYCDPSGLIWDVDQHCYSPFLTPPSPTVDNKSTSSPFANIPLFLTPPPTEGRSFDFFNKDLRSTSSPLMLRPENDHSSVLRRSWSEPLPSSFGSENITSNNEESRRSFGIIGHGRVREVKTVAESLQVNRLEVRSAPAEVPANTVSVMTSQSLEVSTEIVTSPNGHRDIEIKFYSSSPPADSTVVSTSVMRDSSDVGVSDGKGFGGRRTSLSSSVEVCSEGAVNIQENAQQENGESNVNEQAGTGSCKQDAAQCDYIDSVWVGDRKEGCNVFDRGFCEQSAKSLGEEVDQLHLHAEE